MTKTISGTFWNPISGIVKEAPSDKIANDDLLECNDDYGDEWKIPEDLTMEQLFYVIHESKDGYEESDLETFGTYYGAQVLFGLWLKQPENWSHQTED